MDAHKQVFSATRFLTFSSPVWIPVVLIIIAFTVILGPEDRVLGSNLPLILLHGSWVWTGMILFAGSAVLGLAALTLNRSKLHTGSLALSRAGLAFWLTYLPMSLIVMKMNWGGFYFDEPRWSIPFSFAVVGTLLQIGLLLIDRKSIASAANVMFGAALWYSLRSANNVLHPDSPVAQSGSAIQLYFFLLLALTLLLAVLVTYNFYRKSSHTV